MLSMTCFNPPEAKNIRPTQLRDIIIITLLPKAVSESSSDSFISRSLSVNIDKILASSFSLFKWILVSFVFNKNKKVKLVLFKKASPDFKSNKEFIKIRKPPHQATSEVLETLRILTASMAKSFKSSSTSVSAKETKALIKDIGKVFGLSSSQFFIILQASILS